MIFLCKIPYFRQLTLLWTAKLMIESGVKKSLRYDVSLYEDLKSGAKNFLDAPFE